MFFDKKVKRITHLKCIEAALPDPRTSFVFATFFIYGIIGDNVLLNGISQ